MNCNKCLCIEYWNGDIVFRGCGRLWTWVKCGRVSYMDSVYRTGEMADDDGCDEGEEKEKHGKVQIVEVLDDVRTNILLPTPRYGVAEL